MLHKFDLYNTFSYWILKYEICLELFLPSIIDRIFLYREKYTISYQDEELKNQEAMRR